nr:hypothetical protein [Tanacetum cinerariifolium]
ELVAVASGFIVVVAAVQVVTHFHDRVEFEVITLLRQLGALAAPIPQHPRRLTVEGGCCVGAGRKAEGDQRCTLYAFIWDGRLARPGGMSVTVATAVEMDAQALKQAEATQSAAPEFLRERACSRRHKCSRHITLGCSGLFVRMRPRPSSLL